MGEKNQIRRQVLKEVKNHADLKRVSFGLCQKLIGLPAWRNARTVLLYMPLEDEVDISHLFDFHNKTICLPRVSKNALDIYRVRNLDDLERGAFEILEPMKHCPRQKLAKIDLVVVPGVAFTKNGDRLGRGKGFYDRFLVQVKKDNPRVETVSLSLGCQVLDDLPVEGHDVAVDEVVSV